MNHSEQLDQLATALAKAQGAIRGAVKGNVNPAFKSKYADLQALFDAIREPFAANGLCVVQGISTADTGVCCETRIIHASGQWIASSITIPVERQNAHGHASAATYAKRVGLAALSGCASTDLDDDGNAAAAAEPPKKPQVTPQLLADAKDAASYGTAAYRAFYKALNPPARAALSAHNPDMQAIAVEADTKRAEKDFPIQAAA